MANDLVDVMVDISRKVRMGRFSAGRMCLVATLRRVVLLTPVLELAPQVTHLKPLPWLPVPIDTKLRKYFAQAIGDAIRLSGDINMQLQFVSSRNYKNDTYQIVSIPM